MSDWSDQWTECPVCGEMYGKSSAGCDYCARQTAEDEGHVGYFNLTEGWTCYGSCPICYPEDDDE